MPRTFARSIILKALYEWELKERQGDVFIFLGRNFDYFKNEERIKLTEDDYNFAKNLLSFILENLKDIDEIIKINSKEYNFEQIGIIEKNILRICTAELLKAKENDEYKKQVPEKVAINEAVEVSKLFCEEESTKFINGVLGTIFDYLKNNKVKNV